MVVSAGGVPDERCLVDPRGIIDGVDEEGSKIGTVDARAWFVGSAHRGPHGSTGRLVGERDGPDQSPVGAGGTHNLIDSDVVDEAGLDIRDVHEESGERADPIPIVAGTH